MPTKEKSKGGSKGKKKKAKKQVFPFLTDDEIILPYDDPQQNASAKNKVLCVLVSNEPRYSEFDFTECVDTLDPNMAHVESFLVMTHNEVFQPSKDPPGPGLQLETKGKPKGHDGVPLKSIPLKELQKMAVRLNKHKQKMIVSAGIAAKEKEFLKNQLGLVESKTKTAQHRCEALRRETEELREKIRHTSMVYKHKTKHAMTEFHTKAFSEKTDHLDLYIKNERVNAVEEKRHYEALAVEKESASTAIDLLDRVAKDVEVQGRERCQYAKEDYLMLLQAQTDSFETYLSDAQEEVENVVKSHFEKTDADRHATFENMLASQERSISEMRKFFQGVNITNSSIIFNLKNVLNSRRAKLDRVEKDVFATLEDYSRFVAPIQTMEQETKDAEVYLKDYHEVRQEHKKRWEYSKRLEDVVTRLRWKRELDIHRVEKAKEELEQLRRAYMVTMMEAARKADVAELVHDKTSTLLEEEEHMYEMTQLVMSSLSVMNRDNLILRDQRINQIFQSQADQIENLRLQACLIKRKYDSDRATILKLFEEKFKKPLISTGFQFPEMHSYFPKSAWVLLEGVPEEKLDQYQKDHGFVVSGRTCFSSKVREEPRPMLCASQPFCFSK